MKTPPSLVRQLDVFRGSMERYPVVDNLKLCCSVVSSGSHHRPPPREPLVDPGTLAPADLGLDGASEFKFARRGAAPVVRWKKDGSSFQQGLGSLSRDGDMALVVDTNPLRAEARELAGVRARRVTPEDFENFIRPGLLSPAELQARLLRRVARFVTDCVDLYRGIVERLFGRPLTADQVRVSVNEIEVTWDVECFVSGSAPHAFWPSWAQQWSESHRTARNVLAAQVVKGQRMKLYEKAHGVLRYEVQLSGHRARDLLGRRVVLADAEQLRADLVDLAAQLYPPIVEMSAGLHDSRGVDLTELLLGFFDDRRRPAAADLVRALLATGQAKCTDADRTAYRRKYETLRRLRKLGFVESPSAKGVWRVVPVHAKNLHRLRRAAEIFGAHLATGKDPR